MGTALGRALAAHGYKVEAVVAQKRTHALRAAALISSRPLALTTAQFDKLPSSEILLITTPDDAIEDTASRLSATMTSSWKTSRRPHVSAGSKRTALHASGACSSESLRALREVGFATGSMHPLVSVSNSIHGAESLCSAFFCIEGDARAKRVARSLVAQLGGESFAISTKDKILYHAAAVMASGHVTALFDIATEMLTLCGLTRHQARTVFLPLLRSTLENLYASDPARALTGTFARADAATVRRHLRVLGGTKLNDARAVYTLLGLRSLELARIAGARPELLDEIVRILRASNES
jgi:predicted short-subunit dehydrogenase-like oxidoreductase (DUF2520 family)